MIDISKPDFIDLYWGEGFPDWTQLLAQPNLVGAIPKGGDGWFMPKDPTPPGKDWTWHNDPLIPHNWQGLQNAPLRGLYGFLRLDWGLNLRRPNAKQQARNLFDWAVQNGLKDSDEVCADVEQKPDQIGHLSPKQIEAGTREYIEELENLFNRESIIYTFPTWWNQFIGLSPWAKHRRLWIANVGVTIPQIPLAWKDEGWWAWQYSWVGRLPGAKSALDLNVFGNPDRLTRSMEFRLGTGGVSTAPTKPLMARFVVKAKSGKFIPAVDAGGKKYVIPNGSVVSLVLDSGNKKLVAATVFPPPVNGKLPKGAKALSTRVWVKLNDATFTPAK